MLIGMPAFPSSESATTGNPLAAEAGAEYPHDPLLSSEWRCIKLGDMTPLC